MPGAEFLDNWHIHAIAEALRKVHAGETTRLIINVPPRSGKSTLVSIAFTAWLLGHNPRLKIICVSYSEDLAKTHAAAFRAIVKSDWFQRAFPALRIAHRVRSRSMIARSKASGGASISSMRPSRFRASGASGAGYAAASRGQGAKSPRLVRRGLATLWT